MAITRKTIKITAKATLDEFNHVKEFLSHISGLYSYVDNYIISYVLLRNWGYDAIEITSVKTDTEKKNVFIDFESEYTQRIR